MRRLLRCNAWDIDQQTDYEEQDWNMKHSIYVTTNEYCHTHLPD